jgi:uncharacterized membrane protein
MSNITTPLRAFRRVGGGPLQDLGAAGYQQSYALGVSGDGSTVVGTLQSTVGSEPVGQAFRWTDSGGMQPLGWLHAGSRISESLGISRDGSTIVGYSDAAFSEAFVWRQATGMMALPPATPTASSRANAANADGSVVVGASGSYAAVWTSSGVQSLGTLPGSLFSGAYAISDNGGLVGGVAAGGALPQTAFVWTVGSGMMPLVSYLTSAGIAVPSDWTLHDLFAISGDGLTFAGDAVSPSGVIQGFVATVPGPAGLMFLIVPALGLARRLRASC